MRMIILATTAIIVFSLSAFAPAHSADTRFIDMQNGTVYDTVSKRIWLKDANCFGLQNLGNASIKAQALASGQCGLTDNSKPLNWLLPDINTLSVFGGGYPTGFSSFTNVQPEYWSSSYSYSTYYYYMGIVDQQSHSAADSVLVSVWPNRPGWTYSVGDLDIFNTNKNYGNVIPGTTSTPDNIVITNVGTATIAVSSIVMNGADSSHFTVSSGGALPCSSMSPTLAAGVSCTLEVSATPTSSGTKSANLTFTTANGSQDVPLTVNAYNPATYALVAEITGTGNGSVRSSPLTDIACIKGAISGCSGPFAIGSVVNLTATPNSGSNFSGWSGACSGVGACGVAMDAAKSVGAVFTATNGVCGADNGGTFYLRPSWELCSVGTATAVIGNGPWNWTCSGLDGGSNASCSANIQTYTVTTSVAGGNVPLSCTSPINYGSNSVCTITPVSGLQLTGFTDNTIDKLSSMAANSYTIINVTANHTIAATFSDIQKPVVTAFSLSDTATTLTVAVTSLSATDNIAITGYLIAESATAPLASAAEWNTTAQTNYTFSGIISGVPTPKTLYAWAKDAAGNVSTSFTATTTITLPDVTKPVITAFSIPASSNSLNVLITLTATDNSGTIASYCLMESNSSAGCLWTAQKPTTYSFNASGSSTIYAFVKDATGNVSNSSLATTTITLLDTTQPVVTSLTIPANGTNVTVAVSSLTASDNIGVIGYCLTETNSTAGCIWYSPAQTSYTFAGIPEGVPTPKTLYAWAKDAAGNVSTSFTATTTITLPDVTKPVITAFSIPASSNSLTVTNTAFTATDNIAVNAYLLSESGSQPQSNDANWSASQPTQYVFSSQGTKTIYAFAKDASGNISVPLSATVAITLADTTAPVVTSFTLPATAVSLTVPVTALVATDTVGVAGYLLKESTAVPQGNDPSWTVNVPTQYSSSSQGVKTIYAFVKDAAGNISAPLSATVSITLPDTTAPGVSQFTIPATTTSLTVPITSLVATDAVGVAGYLLKESSAVPQGNDPNWTANVPTQYLSTSQGSKILYAFAKDAAGNISAPVSANVTITLTDTTAPVVTAFNIPATATNLTVPVSLFSATDADGVNGYYLSETLTAPLLNDFHWTTTPTSSFTFASTGAKTLYAFAKDVAGNISAPVSATVTIILPDTTAPTVTVFIIPTTATSLIVPITNFTANDNTAITGYILTETATAPQANISGWTSTTPSSYTFSSAGSLTLYAFAKDAAGNVSVPVTASISIALPDTAAPTVATFILPATSSSLTVPVTTYTATDNVAVTGYLLSEGSSTPSPTAQNWASRSQGSYTFSAVGSKTLYAFAKDAAGNISPPASDSVLIALPAITGVCGSSDGQVFTIIPSSNLCSTGTAAAVSGTGPWSWTCSGTNGGTTATCNASITNVPVTQFTVTPTTGSGFTITPATPQAVTNSATTLFNINPTSGFGISSVTGCNGSLNGTTYTTGAITANCTISVTEVARNAGSGGVAQPPTISDALKVLQAVVGKTPLSAVDLIRYDVAPLGSSGNPVGNGAIDAADVILILRRSIGIGNW